MLEHIFEKALWSTRFIVIIAVVLSIMSSITLFLLGGWDIIHATLFNNPLINESVTNNNDLLFKIISSIDLFLIGIVLLIFGFGVYELFISEIDFAKGKFADSTLKINNLDQLKNKIIKVIIIVLIVKFLTPTQLKKSQKLVLRKIPTLNALESFSNSSLVNSSYS